MWLLKHLLLYSITFLLLLSVKPLFCHASSHNIFYVTEPKPTLTHLSCAQIVCLFTVSFFSPNENNGVFESKSSCSVTLHLRATTSDITQNNLPNTYMKPAFIFFLLFVDPFFLHWWQYILAPLKWMRFWRQSSWSVTFHQKATKLHFIAQTNSPNTHTSPHHELHSSYFCTVEQSRSHFLVEMHPYLNLMLCGVSQWNGCTVPENESTLSDHSES